MPNSSETVKHVLLVSRGIPSANDPQWGCFEYDQAEALAAEGWKVTTISVDTRFRFRWRKLGISHESARGVISYNSFLCPYAMARLLGRRFADWLLMMQFRRLFRHVVQTEGRPDIIYSHYLFISAYAVRLAREVALPIVAMEHWSELNRQPLRSDVRKMAQDVYPNVNRLISVSQSLRQRIISLFGVDSTVVHNMVGSAMRYMPERAAHEDFVFVTVGTLLHVKGYDILIEAFRRCNFPKDVKLNIIGSGKEYNNLRRRILQAGLDGQVKLCGRMDKTQILEALNTSDAFVSSSRSENFSVAVLEALACGLPVVASICGGIRECIGENNGLLFEVDDIKGLADALLQMYNHHKDYSRQAVADDCQARFSAPVIARQLTSLFSSLL